MFQSVNVKNALGFGLGILLLMLPACQQATKKEEISILPQAQPTDFTTVYNPLSFDQRLQTIRQGRDMFYPLPSYPSLEEWTARSKKLKMHILISAGLWPLPAKTPLNAKIYDKIEREDYTIEKVYFESFPGFFVTGNLYRPQGKEGPFPGIITPHGHWDNGRLENSELNSVPARCINFAKQGYVVFSYNMVGYQGSKQISHSFGGTRAHELWGINLMGLQLWNSMRAIDFITTLPDVDPARIGCTGASGGASQTFFITAVDERIKVAAPVNMISANYQGDCLCENPPLLRLDTSNVEISALAAPRPLLLVSASGDWTKDNLTIECPMLQSIYEIYSAQDKIQCVQFNAPHNYNKDSREAVYAWFAKWLLHDPDANKYKEVEFTAESPEDLLNFPGDQQPPGDLNEEKLTQYLQGTIQKSLADNWPHNQKELEYFRHNYKAALQDVLAADFPATLETKIMGQSASEGYTVTRLLISGQGKQEWIPAIFYQPAQDTRDAALIVHPEGKTALAQSGMAAPAALIQELLNNGVAVLAIDVFKVGEHILPIEKQGRNENTLHSTTYNKTDLQERVQDIITSSAYLGQTYKVSLVGVGDAGIWALLAASALNDFNALVLYQTPEKITDEIMLDKFFSPGLAHYGGILTALALIAPHKLFVSPAIIDAFDQVKQVYEITGSIDKIKTPDEYTSIGQIVKFISE